MKLGIAVNNLGGSQLNYFLIRQANALLALNPLLDIIVFYEQQTKPCLPMNFASMHMQEAWGYDGVLVATTLSTAEKVTRCPASPLRLFYAWDLEWLRMKTKDYRALARIYRDPNLHLVARNDDHAGVLQSAWNRTVAGVVPDFSLEPLYEIIGRCLPSS